MSGADKERVDSGVHMMRWPAFGLLFIFAASMVNGTILHIAPVNIPDSGEPSHAILGYRPFLVERSEIPVGNEPVKEVVIDKNLFQMFYDNFITWLGGFYHA